jgi:GTP cyclohydrolase I
MKSSDAYRESMSPGLSESVNDRSELALDHVLDHSEQFAMAAGLILRASGDDSSREGLERTPERFRKAMDHLLSGYSKTAREAVGEGIFASEGGGLVSIRDVEFYSLCEHHMLPFWGKASVAYYPRKKILGLSKIPRLVNLFSRRFQVQERLTEQLADALVELINPKAVVVRVQACHLCMMMRGVEKQNSNTVTETTRGLEKLSDLDSRRLLRAVGSDSAD